MNYIIIKAMKKKKIFHSIPIEAQGTKSKIVINVMCTWCKCQSFHKIEITILRQFSFIFSQIKFKTKLKQSLTLVDVI